MVWGKVKAFWEEYGKKYRYALLVLLAGLLLMAIPEETAEEVPVSVPTGVSDSENLEDALSALLSKLDGAGKVQVLLTEQAGQSVCYQTDGETSASSDSRRSSSQTVIITDSQRVQSGLVQRVDPPVYLGAIVLCQGADSAVVRLAIVEAVSNATGLATDRISVLKMK